MKNTQKITTYLWFDGAAEEAVELYTSLFPDSRVLRVSRWGKGGPAPEGSVLNVEFELAGQRFLALNGGPVHRFTPAISLLVSCETQAKLDDLWERIISAGGKAGRCGWVEDKFGLSWQLVPSVLGELMSDPDPSKAGRVGQALMGMAKIDIAGLQRAAAE